MINLIFNDIDRFNIFNFSIFFTTVSKKSMKLLFTMFHDDKMTFRGLSFFSLLLNMQISEFPSFYSLEFMGQRRQGHRTWAQDFHRSEMLLIFFSFSRKILSKRQIPLGESRRKNIFSPC